MYCRGRGERGGRTTQHISVAKHFHQTNLFCLETKLNPLKMQLDLTCMWEYNLQGLKIPLPSSHIEIFPSGYSNTVLCDYALLAIKSKACYKASQIVWVLLMNFVGLVICVWNSCELGEKCRGTVPFHSFSHGTSRLTLSSLRVVGLLLSSLKSWSGNTTTSSNTHDILICK